SATVSSESPASLPPGPASLIAAPRSGKIARAVSSVGHLLGVRQIGDSPRRSRSGRDSGFGTLASPWQPAGPRGHGSAVPPAPQPTVAPRESSTPVAETNAWHDGRFGS